MSFDSTTLKCSPVSKIAEYVSCCYCKVIAFLQSVVDCLRTINCHSISSAKAFISEYSVSSCVLKSTLLLVGIFYILYLINRKTSFFTTTKVGNNSTFLSFDQATILFASQYIFNIFIKLNTRVIEALMLSKYSEAFWKKYAVIKSRLVPQAKGETRLRKVSGESMYLAVAAFQILASTFVLMLVIHIIFSVLNGELVSKSFLNVCNSSTNFVFESTLSYFISVWEIIKTFVKSIFYALKISIKME